MSIYALLYAEVKLITEEKVFTSCCCPRTLNHNAFDPRVAFRDSGRFLLPSAFIVARAQPRPFAQMPRGRERGSSPAIATLAHTDAHTLRCGALPR